MKKIILTLVLLGIYFSINAQNNRLISIGYYAPFAVQAGAKIGTEFPLKKWELRPNSKNPKTRTLAIRPQIAYFTRSGLHQNFLLETDFAYTLKKANKRAYFTPSIGLGYLFSRENVEGSIHLGRSEIDQIKETIHYFFPTLNLEWGKLPKQYIGYFFKTFLGRKIRSQQADSGVVGIEAGLKILLKN